jgi:hypothetical protein
MSSGKPILVVCGATGNQGGSVIAHFLSQSPCPYAIRGITRNTQSEKSLALASKGVEMVAAEFSDRASLDAAFSGASVIFGTTDFWVYFDNDKNREKAKAAGKSHIVLSHDFDIQQNKNIIDAAAKVDTLERFVFSSQANVAKLSGGKYPECYHFDCKALAEEYGRETYPVLWAKTNVLYVGLYLENNVMPVGESTRPKLVSPLTRH